MTAARITNSLKIVNTRVSPQTPEPGSFNQNLISGGLLVTGTSDVLFANGTLNSGTPINTDFMIHQ